MKPYARPAERQTGEQRPRVMHAPPGTGLPPRAEREAARQAVATARRAIKKSARRQLKETLAQELDDLR